MAYRKKFGSRQNYSSHSKLEYRDYQPDEATGKCKCLLKNRREVWLCGDKTRKREFHYCWDCYEMISSEDGRKATTTWPPKRNGKESRYCYDVDTENVFLIPDRWMEEYVDLAKSTGSAIDVKTRSFHSKKDGSDYPCWVYVLRLEDAMLYIGETRNLKRRIYQHKKNPSKTLKNTVATNTKLTVSKLQIDRPLKPLNNF